MGKKSNGKNGKNDRKQGRQEADMPEKPPMLASETKRSIVAVLLAVAGAIFVFGFLKMGGPGGDVASSLSHTLLGSGFFLVPAALWFAALSIVLSLHDRFYAPAFIGAGLMLLSLEGYFHLYNPATVNGGYVGYAIGKPLIWAFAEKATAVILGGLFIISILIAFNVPLKSLLAWLRLRRRAASDGDLTPEETAAIAAGEAKNKHAKAEEVKAQEAVNGKKAKEVVAGDAAQKKEAPEMPLVMDATAKVPIFEVKGLAGEDGKAARKAEKAAVKLAEKPKKPLGAYVAPGIDLLEEETGAPSSGDVKTTATVIKRALATFGIEVEMAEVNVGPTVTQYTLRPASGIKLSRITALAQDLSLALAAHPIRIEAPIPGRSLVGIEIPNAAIMVVRMKNLLVQEAWQKKFGTGQGLGLVLGRDVAGEPAFADLGKMPHLLVAGATGSGKSICIHSILTALLFQHGPEALRLILIDPKRVEMAMYKGIPHLLTPVITDPKKTIAALQWAVREMMHRYEVLQGVGARDLASYNKRVDADQRMPYAIIVIDELADIMAAYGKEVEGLIVRLAQMARAIGIHLIVSTQRPSVEVITGLIKANITSRIAFQVASGIDSRTILDTSGAEKLLGKGDMLYLAADAHKPRRIQSAFVSEKEVEKIVAFIREHNEETETEEAITQPQPGAEGGEGGEEEEFNDPKVLEAEELVVRLNKASTTLLQRHLGMGYARAARVIDILEKKGVVGPGDGAKPREVYGAAPATQAAKYRAPKDLEDDFADEDGEEVGGEEPQEDPEELDGIPVVK